MSTFCPYTGDIFSLKTSDNILKKKKFIYKITDNFYGFTIYFLSFQTIHFLIFFLLGKISVT